MGLRGLEVRKRWFWRKRDGFVGFDREEERFWGGGSHDDGEKIFSEKLNFDCVCLDLLFYL
jgi:hypothetical protein